MSFSGDVKRELQHVSQGARHCMLSELSGFLVFCGKQCMVKEEDTGILHRELWFSTENRCVAARIQMLLRKAFQLQPRVSVSRGKHMAENKQFLVRLMGSSAIDKVFMAIKREGLSTMMDVSFVSVSDQIADARICHSDCCKRALIRSAYMAAGSMSNPENSYHFEIVCHNALQAEQMKNLINGYGLDAKIIQRKKYEVVYVKESEQIVDLLNLMGAHAKLLDLESLRVMKDMRNSINRKVNCETANLKKTVNAAQSQVEDIEYIRDTIGLHRLPENLQETAELRLEYPDVSLIELCEYFEKPIGKSGLNHRLRKLKEIAADLRSTRGID